MTCDVLVDKQDGTRTIICTGRRAHPKWRKVCSVCRDRFATLECDGKKPRKQSGTCDAALCEVCTYRPPNVVAGVPWVETVDLCPKCRDTPDQYVLALRATR